MPADAPRAVRLARRGPPRGVLLHGPPVREDDARARHRARPVPFAIAALEIVAGGAASPRRRFASLSPPPSIIFIDEVDAIVPKRDGAQRQMESRIVAQLLASMDTLAEAVVVPGGEGLSSGEAEERADAPRSGDGEEEEAAAVTARRKAHVTVIGATNRPDGMDAALRRAGRFDREIALGIPDEAARGRILAVQARRLRLAGGLDLAEIAKKTPGYVGADLSALAKEAAAAAVARIFQTFAREGGGDDGTLAKGDEGAAAADDANAGARKEKAGAGSSKISKNPGFGSLVGRLADRRPLDASELEPLAITTGDFAAAIAKVQPSARREGFTTTPAVTWEDVGSLAEVREELAFSVVEPIAHPSRFRAMGLATSTGVLLYGPPGCGKTLVAKATANEAKANFISIKGPELLNKYVGESERAVRTLFARARAASPCVLFFDELDSLAPRRGHSDGGNQASERVVNQLLTEMDGVEARSASVVVAATNRPDAIDPAMLRPGRLDKLLYVPLPPPDGRAAILKTLTRRTPLTPGLDVAAIAASARCEGFSGADLASLVREACVAALKGNLDVARAHDDARERARAMRVAEGGVVGGLSGEAPPLLGDEESNAPPSDSAAPFSDSAAPFHRRRWSAAHFDAAFERVQPSVSAADQRRYDELRRKLRRERGSPRRARARKGTTTRAREPRARRRRRAARRSGAPPRSARRDASRARDAAREVRRGRRRRAVWFFFCSRDVGEVRQISCGVSCKKVPPSRSEGVFRPRETRARERRDARRREKRDASPRFFFFSAPPPLPLHLLHHLLLRLRARVRPHARPALAVLPHAVEHGGAVLLSEILGLARVFAPVRPRVPHPRAVPVEADERGVLVQRHVLRHEGIVRILVEIPRARRRVVVVVPPVRLHLLHAVRALVRPDGGPALALVELAEEQSRARRLVEPVALARELASLRARVPGLVVKVVVPVRARVRLENNLLDAVVPARRRLGVVHVDGRVRLLGVRAVAPLARRRHRRRHAAGVRQLRRRRRHRVVEELHGVHVARVLGDVGDVLHEGERRGRRRVVRGAHRVGVRGIEPGRRRRRRAVLRRVGVLRPRVEDARVPRVDDDAPLRPRGGPARPRGRRPG